MITLTPTLAAAQAAFERTPSLSLVATARRGGAHLLPFTRIYPGDGEADSPHAAVTAADGSLIRARNDAGTLYVQRVTSPALGDDFTAWTNLQTGLVVGSGVALAAISGEVLLMYTRGTTLYYRTSANNGSSWSAEGTAVAHGATISWIAVALRVSTGNACAFFTAGTNLYRLRRTSGTWAGAATSSAITPSSWSGVAAVHDTADFCLLLTGVAVAPGSAPSVWAAQMGDGGLPSNTFTSLLVVTQADSASTTTYTGPSLAYMGAASLHQGAFAHKDSASPAYNRVMLVRPQANDLFTVDWTEPAPAEPTGANGAAVAVDTASSIAFLATPSGVWRATFGGSSDLSSRVSQARVRIGPESARAELVLDNADGLLLDCPNSSFPGLTVGGTLTVNAGYITASGGAEYGTTWSFTIDSIEHVVTGHQIHLNRVSPGARRVAVVRASGGWEQLARWRAPQAWQASGLTRGAIAARIAARSGFPLVSGSGAEAPTGDWTGSSPSFALQHGESGATAISRLLAPINDGLRGDLPYLTIRGLDDPRLKAVAARLAPSLWLPLDDAASGAVIAYDWSGNTNHATTVSGSIVAGADLLTGQP